MRNRPRNASLRGAAPDRSRTALLLLDLVTDFAFEDGRLLLRKLPAVAMRIAKLKARARKAGVPAIYANDGQGRWRSDFPGLVRHCLAPTRPGARLVSLLRPMEDDYCILKPKHSAFFATPLATLLEAMGVRRLILTGVSSHQCVLFTANDAHVRDLELVIPRDCNCAPRARDTQLARRYFERVLGADTRVSNRIVLRK